MWLSLVFALAVVAEPAFAEYVIRTVVGRGIGDRRPATQASLAYPSGVAWAPDGGLLVADRLHHRIRRVDADGTIATFAGSQQGILGDGRAADQAELKEPFRVRVAPGGSLLVTEIGSHRIRRIDRATGLVSTVIGVPDDPGSATPAHLSSPTDAVVDGAGNVYVTDYGHHRIVRLTSGGVVTTVAGTGAPGFGGDGGPAAAAALNGPACVLAAPGGVLFVCDRENHVIRRIANGTITTIAGVPQTPGFTGDGPATTVRLNRPSALARTAAGALLVVDAGNGRLRRIDPTTGALTTLAFGLNDPHDVAVATDGTIVVAETGGHRVRRVGAGGTLTVVAGDGIPFFGGDTGPALDATLTQPKSVALAGDGGLLVADAGNGRVRHVDPGGVIRTVAGSALAEPLGDGGPATAAGMRNPSDAVVDAAGRLVVSDTDHDRIRRVGPGGNVSTLALVSHPTGVEPDAAGNVYVADFEGHRVVRVAPNGTITPVAGNGTPGAAGDGGAALQANLSSPTDLDVDDAGNVLIADYGNHRIRRVDAATGVITTVAGTGVRGASGDGGPAVAARLALPIDVKGDGRGGFLVSDSANHKIRRVSPDGTIATVAGTGAFGDSGDGGPARLARLAGPFRLLPLPDGRVLFADREGGTVRALVPDDDGDRVGDDVDVCPGVADPEQADGDADGVGDACDPCPTAPGPDCTCADGDGDAVCDLVDVCPTVADPGQEDADGDGVGDACEDGELPGLLCPGPTCVAGGGARATDCFAALAVAGARVAGARAECADGDPTCDGDDAPGACTFRLRVCFGVRDPRLAACQPASVANVKLSRPRTRSRKTEQAQAARALLAVLGGSGSSRVVLAGGAGAAGTCTGPAEVTVPIGRRGIGRLRIDAVARTGTGGRRGRDADRVQLVCRSR